MAGIRERLRFDVGLKSFGPEGTSATRSYAQELNYQCGRILFAASLITTFAWLPYLPLDSRLHPEEPMLMYIRIGLSLISLTIFVLHLTRRFPQCNLLFLHIIGAYLVVSSGLIAALTRADSAYLGGYVFLLTLVAVVPAHKLVALLVIAASLATFSVAGYFKGMSFQTTEARYGFQNLLSAASVAVVFIFLLDKMRFTSWLKSRTIEGQARELQSDKERIDKLLLNILPANVAGELKDKGSVLPVFYPSVTIVFTDFIGFTKIAEKLTPDQLVSALDELFSKFDRVMDKYGLEKLKTIGDSYMYAAGLPLANHTHAIDALLGAIEIRSLVDAANREKIGLGRPIFEIRIGIHTGSVMAGVVGEKKFVYDVWGDSVNLASRMESSGEKGKINISDATYTRVKDLFEIEERGRIPVKNKGELRMYFVKRIKAHYSADIDGLVPNDHFYRRYQSCSKKQEEEDVLAN